MATAGDFKMLRKLEKYEILDEIGHGGMATVYRARDERLDRHVALKILHPHLRASPEARQRFEREARSVARLHHPNILEIYDYSGEDSEESYIAAELLSGPNLKHLALDAGEIPPEIAACFVIHIARALSAAHAEGIIHRDVKPENVLIHEGRCVKLADFGIAQIRDVQGFTATGQILGSPGHMAPEQVEAGDVDVRTDIFSLGTVLYYLATGRLPFDGRNPHQVLRRVAEARYADPLRARPSIGSPLARIILKAMAKSPDERHQSAAELEADLVAWLEALGVDEPDATLEAYLKAPDETAAELRARTIDRLIAAGKALTKAKKTREALEAFDRVLAMDEENEEVLALVQAVDRRAMRRRVVLGLVALTALLASLIGLGFGIANDTFTAPTEEVVEAAPPPVEGIDADIEVNPIADPPPVVEVTPDPPVEPDPPTTTPAAPAKNGNHGPRQVVFRPSPQNVRISVDGGESRPFGPDFNQTRLRPGIHRFRFESGAQCCRDVEFSVRVPAGRGPFVVARTLPFRAARLYVISPVPGDVRVTRGSGAAASGRAREIISVPMGRASETRRVVVRSPGDGISTADVRLTAGGLTEHRASFAPVSPVP